MPATGRATARRAASATARSSSATRTPGAADAPAWSCSRLRQTLLNISATIAPELPCAERIAACTTAPRLARLTSGTARAIPASVSRRFEPVSASEMGKTLRASNASAESAINALERRSQASKTSQTLVPAARGPDAPGATEADTPSP